MMTLLTDWILPCCYAFFACVGFCLIFNIHGPGILICGGGGALGWFVYLLVSLAFDNVMLCYLLATIAIALYSELMARLRRCPVTPYLLIAMLPFVPGCGIYETMRYCVQGDTQQFLSALLRTFGIAGSLSIGMLIGSSIVRLILTFRHTSPHR